MADRPEPRAGGALLALATIGGAVAGLVAGQPSAGVIGGAGIGTAAALAIWLRDRARAGR